MTESAPEYDLLAKIIVIGESGVGKTMIWNRYCEGHFYDYKSTIGVEFKTKTIDVDGKRAKLQIWDTSGQERFRTISRSYYRGVTGVLLCYAIDDSESFEKIEYWMKEVKENANKEDIRFVLVGTKCDLSDKRVVSLDEGRQFAESYGMKFFETSAKENINVDEAFLGLAKEICAGLNKKKDETKIDSVAAPEYDFLAKIIVLGESGVGKTCLWHRYLNKHYSPNYKSTIGVEFGVKTIDVDGKRVKLQIWDTSGQERFRAISRSYYRGATGVLLCYAIDNRESFEKIEDWLREVKENTNEKDICFVLVGTKSDLSDKRVVSIDEGRQLAGSLGMQFFETSAKEGRNVDEVFLGLAKDMSVVLKKKKNNAKIDSVAGTQSNQGENNPQIQIQRANNPQIQIVCFKCS